MTRWLVVGGGSAGCVVAARLSEDETNEVTLLEAGSDTTVRPSGVGPIVDDPTRLRAGVTVVRCPGGPPEPYVQGAGLGGSSLVNGSIAVGEPTDLRVGHLLPVEPAEPVGPIAAAVLAATQDAARVGTIARDGQRVTTADAYLRPVMGRANLTVTTGARAERLVFDGRRSVGVVVDGGAATDREVAADRVVLCAGAIESPAILLRSGVDTPGVGRRLQDHPGVTITLELSTPGLDVVPIAVTVERPRRQIVVIDRLPGEPSLGALLAGVLDVASEGRVTLGPDGAAKVELAQLTAGRDADRLAGAAREAADLADSPGLRDVTTGAYVDAAGSPLSTIAGDGDLRRWLPAHLGGYHHLAGSCRVGTALDADGALIGYERVFVCDASSLPSLPPRNPYLTVVRHAEAFARRHRSP